MVRLLELKIDASPFFNEIKMDKIETEIVIASIAFHTFILALVRPFLLNIFQSLTESLVQVDSYFKKNKILRTKKDKNDYYKVEMFKRWEGTVSFFGSTFWIFSIIASIFCLLKYLNCLGIINLSRCFFFLTLFYLLFTFIVIIIRFEYINFGDFPLGASITLFFVFPLLLYTLIYKSHYLNTTQTHDLSFIILVWFLSILYLIIWHFLWAYYKPLSSIENLMKKSRKLAE